MRQLTKPLLLALLLWLAGCSGGGGGGALPGFGSCVLDSDCAEGLVCSPAWLMCVAGGNQEALVLARLIPPADSPWVEEQYGDLEVSGLGLLNLLLHRAVTVQATVLQTGGAPLGQTKLRVVAAAPGQIPGKDYHHDAFQRGNGSFRLTLAPGRLYDLYIDFQGDEEEALRSSLPPYHVRRSFSPDWAAADPWTVPWEVILPDPATYLKISGLLLQSVEGAVPVSGATVFLYSKASGDASTTAVTGPDGRFELLVQPPTEGATLTPEYALHIQPSASNAMVPSISGLGSYYFFQDLDLGTLELGSEAAPAPFSFTVRLEEGAQAPRSDLTLHLQGRVGLGSLRLEYQVYPDEPLELELPRGLYTAAVVPGTDSELAIASLSFTQAEAGLTWEPTLGNRHSLSGTVSTSEGAPVPGARVAAVVTGSLEGPLQIPKRRFEAFSDDEGRFELLLDPGFYLLVLDPPADSGLPRTLLDGVTVDSDQVRSLRFDDPLAVTGRLSATAAQGSGAENGDQPVAGVKLEFYPAGAQGPLAQEPLATGWSDEEGRYLLVLPGR